MLLFRGNDWHKGLSPEEMQDVANQWMTWFNRLTQQGKVLAGNPLEPEGKTVSGKSGFFTPDDLKGLLMGGSGYFLLRVDTFDEAVAIAQQCPGLAYGVKVEVRPVAEQCPMASEAALAEGQLAAANS